jgi:HSP20 family protein
VLNAKAPWAMKKPLLMLLLPQRNSCVDANLFIGVMIIMTMLRFSPLEEVSLLRNQLDRLFETPTNEKRTLSHILPVELLEKGNEYTVKLAMPGMGPSDIKVESTQKELTISAKKQPRELDKDERVYVSEFEYGSFSKHLTFPCAINTDAISASYDQGILTVSVPKAESAQPKQIEVKIVT